MQKYLLSLLLLCFVIVSCSNNFEKISKNPEPFSLKKEVNQADFVGRWESTNIVIQELDESNFNSELAYNKYVEGKKRMKDAGLGNGFMNFSFAEDGTMEVVTPDGKTHTGTYSIANNQLKTIEKGDQEIIDIKYFKKDDLILQLNVPNPDLKEKEHMGLFLIMKRQ